MAKELNSQLANYECVVKKKLVINISEKTESESEEDESFAKLLQPEQNCFDPVMRIGRGFEDFLSNKFK
ncbi:hypothetical protein F8388_012194 [Cannabis sativa]|uniref:Uncharacterized protein n=1 Tax=Cannabis sativa TaxID=3483 RepID=A0A7J6H6U6_CANSA|nr:hypothetical protein F8388_012194 [Cannabis sativa]KAF4390997.1 hypothetical protein G4B88_030675 [Cannabis sativa]